MWEFLLFFLLFDIFQRGFFWPEPDFCLFIYIYLISISGIRSIIKSWEMFSKKLTPRYFSTSICKFYLGHANFELCNRISEKEKSSQNPFSLFTLGSAAQEMSFEQKIGVENLVTLSIYSGLNYKHKVHKRHASFYAPK